MTRRIITALLAATAATACAPQPKVTPEPLPQLQIVETLETDADRLLNYYAYMNELQGDSLEREYRSVRKSYDANQTDFNRMQLIMLLSSPSASFRDTELAHSLLKDWLNEDYQSYSKLRPLALLLDNYLSELGRIAQAKKRTASQMREASDLIARQSDRIAQQKAALATEQQRTQELQSKLDALLEMERNLIERERLEQPNTP
jgi:hypothetical protein